MYYSVKAHFREIKSKPVKVLWMMYYLRFTLMTAQILQCRGLVVFAAHQQPFYYQCDCFCCINIYSIVVPICCPWQIGKDVW